MIQIRLAKKEDIPSIMKFIDEYWKKNHVMATDLTLFQWQHVRDEKVNYIIGEDSDTGEIFGTMGFVTMNSENNPDVSSMMIKARKCQRDFLGCDMATFLGTEIMPNLYYSPGLNMKTAGVMAEIQGSNIEKMSHYYRLNDLEQYNIAEIHNKSIPVIYHQNTICIEINSIEEFSTIISVEALKNKSPFKDVNYIEHRYFKHPYYKYKVCAFLDKKLNKSGVIVLREVTFETSKALRIIDFFGDDQVIKDTGYFFDLMMKENEYEYVDFYNYGISKDIIQEAGFVERTKEDVNIIPNFFEPFERKNGDIYFHTSSLVNLYAYKGDGDQDRPNVL